jgi:hypothetical protein
MIKHFTSTFLAISGPHTQKTADVSMQQAKKTGTAMDTSVIVC